MTVRTRDVAEGLWVWRQPHPDWQQGADWEPEVSSFAVCSRGVALLLDPLAPPPAARDVWERLDALAPSEVVVLKPDHVRNVDLFVRWYGARRALVRRPRPRAGAVLARRHAAHPTRPGAAR